MRLRAHWWLSSGQTIGAARTAVRSACCLPERPGANRLWRLYPLDTRFPPFPPCTPSDRHLKHRAPHRAASPALAPESARQAPPGGGGYAPAGAPKGFPLALWKPSGRTRRKTCGINIPAKNIGLFSGQTLFHPEPKSAAHTARPIFLFFFKRNAQVIIFLRCVLKNPLQPGQISLHLSLAAARQHHDQR